MSTIALPSQGSSNAFVSALKFAVGIFLLPFLLLLPLYITLPILLPFDSRRTAHWPLGIRLVRALLGLASGIAIAVVVGVISVPITLLIKGLVPADKLPDQLGAQVGVGVGYVIEVLFLLFLMSLERVPKVRFELINLVVLIRQGAMLLVPLIVFPATALLFVLNGVFQEDAEEPRPGELFRWAARRSGKMFVGLLLGLLVLLALAIPATTAAVLLQVFKVPVMPALVVMMGIYLEDLVVLFLIGKVPLSYNFRNLSLRWLTTAMTASAFFLVIGLLTILLSFVNGMDRLTEGSGQPGNVMVLSDGATDELFSNLSPDDVGDVERQPGVIRQSEFDGQTPGKDDKDPAMASKEVYIVVNQPIPPDVGETAALSLRGTIKSIAGDKDAFVVTDDATLTDSRFRVGDDLKVLVNKNQATFDHLRLGDRVWVAYEKRGNDLWAVEARGSNRRRFVQLRGIDDGVISGKVHGLRLSSGEWFSDTGVRQKKVASSKPGEESEGQSDLYVVEVVLGEGVARELGQDYKKKPLEVNDVFELGPRKWIVVGIMQSSGSTFGSEVWAKRGVVGPMFGKYPNYSCVVLRTKGAGEAEELARFLKTDYKKVALNAQTEPAYYSKLSETNKQFSIAIYFLTIIMAIGGVFGVMNTMFAAISQRTKDIGMMRIVGFQRWQILVSFLLESLVIGLIGGTIGALVAYLSFDGVTATSIISAGQGGGKTVILKLTVTATTFAIGLLFTLKMGRVGGLLPALSAMRLKALDSLR
jgi:ABC-type antimicrobial peptide transport system permease subunit